MKSHYIIIDGKISDLDSFEGLVNDWLLQGYELAGELLMHEGKFYQSLIKPKGSDISMEDEEDD
jgi:hypothetical protein